MPSSILIISAIINIFSFKSFELIELIKIYNIHIHVKLRTLYLKNDEYLKNIIEIPLLLGLVDS